MKAKIFSLLILAAILVSMVSALSIDPATQVIDATDGSTVTGTFNVLNDEGSDVNVTISDGGLTFTPDSFTIADGQTRTVQFSYAVPDDTAPGIYTYPFTVNSDSAEIQINVLSSPTLSISTIDDLRRNDNVTTFTVSNDGNVALTNIELSYDDTTIVDDSGKQITLEFSANNFALGIGQSQDVTLTATIPQGMDVGEWTTKISADSATGASAEKTAKIVSDYCTYGRIGGLLEITRLKDEELDNEDSWEWRPLDNVEIEVKVRNNDDDDQDVTVELALYDVEDQAFVDEDELEDLEDSKEIKDGKTEEFKFNFEVPTELEEKTYRLYVKAYFEDSEEEQCTDIFDSSMYEEVEIKKSSRDIVITEIETPDFVGCGDEATIHARVYNTGENDEEEVKVRIYNRELGINEEHSTFDLDEGDSEAISFVVTIPEDAEEKTYIFDLSAEFDYDEDDDVYDKETDNFEADLIVEGNCLLVTEPLISAELVSDAVAGEELNIRATITNTGTKELTYTVTATGYDSWGSLGSVTPASLTIAPGASASTNIYLTSNADVEGEKLFTIKAVYDGKIAEQSVSVVIGDQGLGFDFDLGENWLMWLIVIINVILIIAIIIVVARILSR